MCSKRRTMDLELDIARPIDNFDLAPPPTMVRKNDFVKWQSSQSTALDTLRGGTSYRSPRRSKSRSTSLTTPGKKTLTGISKSTSSRRRSSRGSKPLNSDALPPVMQNLGGFINGVKTISERVNDTRAGKPNSSGEAHAENDIPGASGVRRVVRNVGLGSLHHDRPTGKSRDIVQQNTQNGKGKEKEVNPRRSLPTASKSLPSVDLADRVSVYDHNAMDIDACATASSSRTRSVSPAASGSTCVTMPPPRSRLRPHITLESTKNGLDPPLSTASPKLHPLLQHPPISQQLSRPPSSAAHKPQVQPQPSTQTPPHTHPGQSTRPPALGMRRAHTLPSSTPQPRAHVVHAVPTKQKVFKPPLLSQSQPNHSQATARSTKPTSSGSSSYSQVAQQIIHVSPLPCESQHIQSLINQLDHCHSTSASPPPGPDDSFGNISFGMDVDDLENVLKLYD